MSISNKIRGLKEIWGFDNHWYLALTRFLFPNETVNIYRYNGLEILIDHSAGDANGAREVLTSDMYRQYLPLMKLTENVNVFDLGANNGGFPLLLKSQGVQIKKNVSVELNPNTFSRLKFNLERNFDAQAIALNAGVCGTPREIEIKLGIGSVADSIYENSPENKSHSFIIQGKTFDEIYREYFGQENVDVCKMDIEGAEFEVFNNGTCEKLKNCRYLLMEIHHDKNKRRELIQKELKEMGFEEFDAETKIGEINYVHFFENKRLSK